MDIPGVSEPQQPRPLKSLRQVKTLAGAQCSNPQKAFQNLRIFKNLRELQEQAIWTFPIEARRFKEISPVQKAL